MVKENQRIIYTNDVAEAVVKAVESIAHDKLFVIDDVNVNHFVTHKLTSAIQGATIITIKSGDMNKNIETLSQVWKELCNNGATRHSLVLNIGGGVVTDLGGFAASTFKRGINFINIPTTLLAAVDAAVGGKTGINFNGFKNEVGAFNEANMVIISTAFLNTLPDEEILSGYAEMIKHGLITDKDIYNRLIDYVPNNSSNNEELLQLLKESVQIKEDVVLKDPTEKGIRKALNFGHTIGHAFESYSFERSDAVPHGYAVAWGMVVELILSQLILKSDSATTQQLAKYVYDNYGVYNITCNDYEKLYTLMTHDKKNDGDGINFTLLKSVGDIKINCKVSKEIIFSALDIYRDMFHI